MNRFLAIIISLLAFPCFITIMGLAGFIFGTQVTKYYAPLALFFSVVICGLLERESRRACVLLVIGVVLFSVFIASLPVMYCVSDSLNCYRVGIAMIVEGWNPLVETEVSDVVRYGWGFNPWHVAYAFKIPFIYGASMCKTFGFSAAGDSLNFILLAASFITVYVWLCHSKHIAKVASVFLSLGIILSPNVIRLLIGGKSDPALYQCIVIVLLGCDFIRMNCHWGWRVAVILATALASGIKPTGLIVSCLIILCYVIYEAFISEKGMILRKRVALEVLFLVCAASLAILINPSPILTSTIRHGTPLYPMRTTDGAEVPQSVTQLTGDCDIMNDDARELGLVGRYVRAYISQTVVDTIMSWKLHKPFQPEWPDLFTKPTGLGSAFRFIYTLALLGWFFVKDRSVLWMSLAIFLTTIIVPIKFIGLPGYVQQIYLIPPLIAIGLWMRNSDNQFVHKLLVPAITIYCFGFALPNLGFVPYVWLASVQNLQILDAVEKDENPVIESKYYYGHFLWKHDSTQKVILRYPTDSQQCASNMRRYSSVARRYDYLRLTAMPDTYYDFSFMEVSRQDHAKRREGAASYFTKVFLPREYKSFVLRIIQWSKLRSRQFFAVWSEL